MLVRQMLAGTRQWAQLMALNASDPDGWAPGHSGSTGGHLLYSLAQILVRMPVAGGDCDCHCCSMPQIQRAGPLALLAQQVGVPFMYFLLELEQAEQH